MTTNYVDRLDSALIRPGRVDMAQFIADATPFQVQVTSACLLTSCVLIMELVCLAVLYFIGQENIHQVLSHC
jgi:hypothetical protein